MFETSLAFKRDQKYIVLDCETESLNLVGAKPFQLSWVVADNERVIESHDEYIYFKDLKMSAEAEKITKFDWQVYKSKASDPVEIYQKFSKYLFDPSYILVCQNFLNFDCYMIKNLQKLTGHAVDYSYLSRVVDTKVIFIAMQKEIKYDPSISFLKWQYKVNSLIEKGMRSSQEYMLNYFEIPFDKNRLHEALYDVTMLYEIFKKMLRQNMVPDLTSQKETN
jgi:DNA polymerase III epsilon subunit-like protein